MSVQLYRERSLPRTGGFDTVFFDDRRTTFGAVAGFVAGKVVAAFEAAIRRSREAVADADEEPGPEQAPDRRAEKNNRQSSQKNQLAIFLEPKCNR